MKRHILFFVSFVLLIVSVSSAEPVVTLPYAKVVGTGDDVQRFLGVPYAELNTKRFTEGKEIDESKHNAGSQIDATQEGKSCPQDGVDPSYLSEDCLNLNIGRPKGLDKLPVMVFIYGVSFILV